MIISRVVSIRSTAYQWTITGRRIWWRWRRWRGRECCGWTKLLAEGRNGGLLTSFRFILDIGGPTREGFKGTSIIHLSIYLWIHLSLSLSISEFIYLTSIHPFYGDTQLGLYRDRRILLHGYGQAGRDEESPHHVGQLG